MLYPELLLVAAFVAIVWRIARELPPPRRITVGALTALGVLLFLVLLGAYLLAVVSAAAVALAFVLLAKPRRVHTA